MSVTIRGPHGALVWEYYPAGTVRDWTVTRTAEGQTVQATIVTAHPVWIGRRPLVFIAQHPTGAWRWPLDEPITLADGTLTARLGPRQD